MVYLAVIICSLLVHKIFMMFSINGFLDSMKYNEFWKYWTKAKELIVLQDFSETLVG